MGSGQSWEAVQLRVRLGVGAARDEERRKKRRRRS
jgi:hypothetical protein